MRQTLHLLGLLCLACSSLAGRPAPAFITDNVILQLYAQADVGLEKVTWSKNTDVVTKFDLEFCHDGSDSLKFTTPVVIVRIENSETPIPGGVQGAAEKKKCYTFKKVDKIAVEGKALTFVLRDGLGSAAELITKGDKKFAVGAISKYLTVKEAKLGGKCPTANTKVVTFGSPALAKGEFGKNCFQTSGVCLFASTDESFTIDDKLVCIKKGTTTMQYCQEATTKTEVDAAGDVVLESLDYVTKKLTFKTAFVKKTDVLLYKAGVAIKSEVINQNGKDMMVNDLENSDALYTICAQTDSGIKKGLIQDLKVNVEKIGVAGKPYYSFSFKHMQSPGNKYQASVGTNPKDKVSINCQYIGAKGNCYGFLQPATEVALKLSYFAAPSTVSNTIIVPKPSS